MLRNFLSYQDKGTCIHQLNPVVKLTWTGSVVLVAMIIDHPVVLVLIFLSTVPIIAAAGIWRQWAVIMQLAIWMGVLVIVINTLASPGGSHLLWQSEFSLPILGPIRLTLEAILYGLFMTVRLMAIISAFSLISFTIRPDELLVALLEMRLPYKTAMMIALSIRFVPAMLEDAERIADAQRSRGLEMDKGSKIARLKGRIPLLSSLLSTSLERTIQLAEAMEARAFGSVAKRTQFFRLNFRKVDIFMIVLLLAMLIMLLAVILTGGFSYEYYPALQGSSLKTSNLVASIATVLVIIGLIPAARFGCDE